MSWEIKVIEQPWMMTVKIYILERGRINSLVRFNCGKMEMREITEGEAVEDTPTMTLPSELWSIMKEVLIDKKVEEKSTIEGELKATKYHLQDLRSLLKLK